MIVASILLAFSIDAAWEEFQARSEEAEALRALLVDFAANRAQALDVIYVHEAGHSIVGAAVRRERSATLSLAPDSVASVIVAMANPRTFDPVRATLYYQPVGGERFRLDSRPV